MLVILLVILSFVLLVLILSVSDMKILMYGIK